MNVLRVSVLVALASALPVACGGRTSDLLPDDVFPLPDAGTYGEGGSGTGSAGGAGNGGRPVVASGGRAPSGGSIGSGGVSYGYGGKAVGGFYGSGGYYGTGGYYAAGGYYGYGGYFGAGGYYGTGGYYASGGQGGFGGGCSYPLCDCGSCFENCLCRGSDTSFCLDSCIAGGGGGAGGVPIGGSYICAAEVCKYSLPSSCCTAEGHCGVGIDDSVSSVLAISSGCQALNQPGSVDYACPPVTSGGTNAVQYPPCCTSNGLCGISINDSLAPLGCVATYTPFSRSCDGYPVGGAPSGGFGGSLAAGGSAVGSGGTFVGSGGFSSGGSVGVGGVGGAAGAPVQQCVSQARSDCERCACGSCYDTLIPCFKDTWCPQILACANRTGCTGADCLDTSTCADVIDKAGGIGASGVQLALPLFGCLQATNCACGFK
ncbi:MAG TPA: hypothetical protein VH062_14660 [Polyangiaceae bacterium]|nr:hypothetical protein [Polyangiaceae bacterium]